jgi:hypothetical protein
MEALLLLIDMLLMLYLCWRLFRSGANDSDATDLGLLHYKEDV